MVRNGQTQTLITSLRQLYQTYQTNPGFFSGIQAFPRASMLSEEKEPTLYINPGGRIVLVEIADEVYAVPHPQTRIDAVSYHDTGLKNFFECRGYRDGACYDSLRMREPAHLRQEGDKFILLTKGVLDLR